jgi:hypothetical protein
MYYKFPRSLKGENTIGNFFSFSSIPFVLFGLMVWVLLFYTIGRLSGVVAHLLGALVTLSMYLLSLFSMPEKNIFGGNGQKVYMIIFYILTNRRTVYVPYIDVERDEEDEKKSFLDKLFS